MYAGFFRHALFPAYETLTGRGTHRFLEEYRRNQWLDSDSIERIQLDKLNALLDFCWRQVPYLQRRWREVGLQPRRLMSICELEAFPILTKAEITANYQDMTSLPWRGRSMVKTTGGTTGDPFRFEYTGESYARRTAVMWRGYEWADAGPGVRAAYLWIDPTRQPGWRGLKERAYQRGFNRKFFDVFGMTEGNVGEYAESIARYGPTVVVGYVRPVLKVAQWLNDCGRRMRGIKSVLTGAEPLYEAERRQIEDAFSCPVFNTYGCREFMLLASECEQHEGLHVNADHLVVETVDSSGRAVVDGAGDVVVTDLHNSAMPLVRYRNGDMATPKRTGACGCGRGLPMLQSVDGRVLDLIITPDGRHLPGEFFIYVFLGRTAVRQYQVVQVQHDELEVRVALAATLPRLERERIVDQIGQAAGPTMRIHLVEVDEIRETASGKRRVTISLDSHRAAAGTGSAR